MVPVLRVRQVPVASEVVPTVAFGASWRSLEGQPAGWGDLAKSVGGGHGMFVGPRGGKWADAAHTVPWHDPNAPGTANLIDLFHKHGGKRGWMKAAHEEHLAHGGHLHPTTAPLGQGKFYHAMQAALVEHGMQEAPKGRAAGAAPAMHVETVHAEVKPAVASVPVVARAMDERAMQQALRNTRLDERAALADTWGDAGRAALAEVHADEQNPIAIAGGREVAVRPASLASVVDSHLKSAMRIHGTVTEVTPTAKRDALVHACESIGKVRPELREAAETIAIEVDHGGKINDAAAAKLLTGTITGKELTDLLTTVANRPEKTQKTGRDAINAWATANAPAPRITATAPAPLPVSNGITAFVKMNPITTTHVVKMPSGRFGYAGKVPADIGYVDATDQQMADRQFGHAFGPKERTFATAKEAFDFATAHGREVTDSTPAETPRMSASAPPAVDAAASAKLESLRAAAAKTSAARAEAMKRFDDLDAQIEPTRAEYRSTRRPAREAELRAKLADLNAERARVEQETQHVFDADDAARRELSAHEYQMSEAERAQRTPEQIAREEARRADFVRGASRYLSDRAPPRRR